MSDPPNAKAEPARIDPEVYWALYGKTNDGLVNG